MRVKKVLMAVLGLCCETVVRAWELHDGDRSRLEGGYVPRRVRRGRCGRCGELASFYDQGGGERRWRHVDVGFATCELIADARRVGCPVHGPTVAAVPWARHDSAFSRAFEDLVVHDAVVGNKQAAADRYGVSWRAVNNMCVRVATEALGRVDLLDGLVAVAIDEVKYKKGQRYLTVVCDHFTGKVVWAAKGRSKETVGEFFDALGDERAALLQFVSADGAAWIRDVVAERAPKAIVCLDTFHVVSWATDALDEVRRGEWNELRRRGGAAAAKALKRLRYLLLRNWENLTGAQCNVIRDLQRANRTGDVGPDRARNAAAQRGPRSLPRPAADPTNADSCCVVNLAPPVRGPGSARTADLGSHPSQRAFAALYCRSTSPGIRPRAGTAMISPTASDSFWEGHMSRSDQLRQSIDGLNARDFVAAASDFADNLKFHAPGLGLDVEGRDTVMKHVSEFVQQADVHYELEQVVEHGPFVVAFAQSTGTLDGQRMTWDLCEVLRYEGDETAEVWALRGGPPRPTST